MIRSSWLLAACTVAFAQHAAAQCEQQQFLGTDTVDYDYLGHGVSIEGDLALVPAYWKSVAKPHDGKVYVVRRVGGVWTEEAQLTASVPLDMAWLGYSTALSGSRALVGALREGPQGVEHGGAYVFAQVGGAWVEEAHLVTDTPDFYGGFGVAVALQDELALVGAWSEFNDFGVVHVYERGAHASWNQGAPIVAGDGQPGDYFGCSIALDGDTAVVGAMHVSVPGVLRVGAVYVFRRGAAGDWSLEQKLPAPQTILDGRFGYDVALQGDRLVAGAPHVDGSAARSGAVYVYERVGTTWSQAQVLTAPDGAAWDEFGYSVALSGDRLAVGAPYDDVEHDAGSAYVFERAGRRVVARPEALGARRRAALRRQRRARRRGSLDRRAGRRDGRPLRQRGVRAADRRRDPQLLRDGAELVLLRRADLERGAAQASPPTTSCSSPTARRRASSASSSTGRPRSSFRSATACSAPGPARSASSA
jgi:hypothetical protein